MHMSTGSAEERLIEAAIFDLLARKYPAQLAEDEVISQVSRDPGDVQCELSVIDALRQLQADQLIRRLGQCWAATLAAVKAYELLES